jgi:outer membrane protein OmpU
MKKVLLGTASVLGMALLAQPAAAQITVKLGGYTDFRVGFWNDDRDNSTDREFRNDTEVHVRADGKADNGLLYGVAIEIDSSGSALNYDEANLYVAGGWGRIEMGDQDGASDQLAVYAPSVGIGQLWGDQDSFLANALIGGDALYVPDSNDGTKISYFTPSLAGFRAGVSYAPEQLGSPGGAGDSVALNEQTNGSYSDWIEAGVRYSGEFSGATVALGATYSQAEGNDLYEGTPPALTREGEDFRAWQVGAQVGFGGFTVGGGYTDYKDFLLTRSNVGYEPDTSWNVGAAYSAGPFGVAAGYLNLDDESGADYTIWSVGAVYTVAPGLAVQADYYNLDNEIADDDGQLIVLSTRVTF